MTKQQRMWTSAPTKPAKPAVPASVKDDLEARANTLITSVLKPRHIAPAPADQRFNYITDIHTKWHRNYFYFCATYCCPGPGAVSPSFETKFARLEYIGHQHFNLSYLRHTGQWFEIHTGLLVQDCLDAISQDPNFLA